MNVVLHGWPSDPKSKRMHLTQTSEFQYMLTVPVWIWSSTRSSWSWKSSAATEQDLIFRFIYHDGEHYHYELTQQEFA